MASLARTQTAYAHETITRRFPSTPFHNTMMAQLTTPTTPNTGKFQFRSWLRMIRPTAPATFIHSALILAVMMLIGCGSKRDPTMHQQHMPAAAQQQQAGGNAAESTDRSPAANDTTSDHREDPVIGMYKGHKLYLGPKGGRYYISPKGSKVYISSNKRQ